MQNLILYNGDIMSALSRIPNDSIDCIVTSPPYYAQRRYKAPDVVWGGSSSCEHEWNQDSKCNRCNAWKGQLGNEPDYNAYLDHLLLITAELKRIMKPSGTLFWNIDDSYSGSNQGAGAKHKSPNGIQDITEDYFAAGTNRKSILAKQDIPAKSLMQIPARFAIKMIDTQDWILRNDLIWRKLTGMPESVEDRLSNKYEHIYFFVKKRDYYFNLDVVRTQKNYPNQRVKELCEEIYKRAKEMRNQVKFLSYGGKHQEENQEIMLQKENSETKNKPIFRSSAGTIQEFIIAIRTITREVISSHPELTKNDIEFLNNFQQNASGNPNGSNPCDILTINTESYSGGHHAVFPRELPRFCIKVGCPEGGVVLDPFAGSGTTLEVARGMGLNAIGIEISEEYVKLIKKRLAWGFDPDVEWRMVIV